jgi:hypothetical protein
MTEQQKRRDELVDEGRCLICDTMVDVFPLVYMDGDSTRSVLICENCASEKEDP